MISGDIIVAKSSEMESKYIITCMKHVNQPVMKATQKIRLKVTKNGLLLRRKN